MNNYPESLRFETVKRVYESFGVVFDESKTHKELGYSESMELLHIYYDIITIYDFLKTYGKGIDSGIFDIPNTSGIQVVFHKETPCVEVIGGDEWIKFGYMNKDFQLEGSSHFGIWVRFKKDNSELGIAIDNSDLTKRIYHKKISE